MLAKQLQEALRRKGWSIKQAAEASHVDRFFLNRLIRGGDPPRTRVGRHTAEHDERYRRIAEALELDVDAFIATARRAQLGGEGEVDLADRYPEFRHLLLAHLPIRTERDIQRLLEAALKDLAPRYADELSQRVLSSLEAMTRSALSMDRHRNPDYLGLGGSEPPLDRLATRGTRLCNKIGDALVQLGDIGTLRDRVRLAALFYEIALSVGESPR